MMKRHTILLGAAFMALSGGLSEKAWGVNFGKLLWNNDGKLEFNSSCGKEYTVSCRNCKYKKKDSHHVQVSCECLKSDQTTWNPTSVLVDLYASHCGVDAKGLASKFS